jgi:hypothetical protein
MTASDWLAIMIRPGGGGIEVVSHLILFNFGCFWLGLGLGLGKQLILYVGCERATLPMVSDLCIAKCRKPKKVSFPFQKLLDS